MPSSWSLTPTAAAIVVLVFLIARLKLNAFVALVLVSLGVGLASGMPLDGIARAFQDGVGATLGFVSVVIGLGTILGKMLAESGGAGLLARRIVSLVGDAQQHWALVLVAIIVGLPVFFNVGLVLLAPIVFALGRETRAPLLLGGIATLAGLSAAHGLVPPHPGPLAAIDRLGADTGLTLLYSLIVGVPTAIVAGPLFAPWIARRIDAQPGALALELSTAAPAKRPAGLALTLTLILLPVALMLAGTTAELLLLEGNPWRERARFVGHPLVALLAAVLVAWIALRRVCGFSRSELLAFSEASVAPIASVLLVVGAGGGFGRVLDHAGVDEAIGTFGRDLGLSPLLMGWLVAAILRVAVGSATVAITTSASLMLPIADAMPGVNRELLVLAMGAGSLIASHLNDGGFWLVKEYFNLSVMETLRSWTVMETIISVAALVFVLALDLLV
jgi:gluconate:H+ symporter, GntP family